MTRAAAILLRKLLPGCLSPPASIPYSPSPPASVPDSHEVHPFQYVPSYSDIRSTPSSAATVTSRASSGSQPVVAAASAAAASSWLAGTVRTRSLPADLRLHPYVGTWPEPPAVHDRAAEQGQRAARLQWVAAELELLQRAVRRERSQHDVQVRLVGRHVRL